MNNIAIFASANGSNADAIMTHFDQNPHRGTVAALLTNNDQAYAIQRAIAHKVTPLTFKAKELRESPEKIIELLDSKQIDFIVLAGFMLLLPPLIVERYANRIVNIHPALLPAYGGKGMYGDFVHQAVMAKGEKYSGITIHYVNEHYDKGDIIFQAKVEVAPNETPDSLAQKIHQLEHKHYPIIIDQVINQPK